MVRLALLVPVLFLGSCINNDNKPFEAPPELLGSDAVLIDTVTASLETFRLSGLQSDGFRKVVAGSWSDGILGTFNSEACFQFLPEAYPLVYPSVPVADDYTKGTLILRTDFTYGRFGQNEWGLFPLLKPLDGDRTYFMDDAPHPAEPVPAVTTQGATRDGNIIRVDAGDFARAFMARWKTAGRIGTDQDFLSLWPGFALRSLQTIPQAARFDLNYGSQEAPAFLEIQYRPDSNLNSPVTLRFLVPPRAVHAFRAFPDFSGTRWAALSPGTSLPATPAQPEAAVQDLTGLAIKLKFPGLSSLSGKLSPSLRLFRAELILTPDSPGSLSPPAQLRIGSNTGYRMPDEGNTDEIVFNDQIILQAIRAGLSRDSARLLGGTRFFDYSESKGRYTCDITTHVKNILSGLTRSTDLNLYSPTLDPSRLILKPGSVKLRLIFNRI